MDGVCVLAFFLWQGGDSGKLSLQVLCNANGSCRLVLPGVLVVACFFFSSSQRLTREHLLKDKIKKPMAVYFEDSVFAFT